MVSIKCIHIRKRSIAYRTTFQSLFLDIDNRDINETGVNLDELLTLASIWGFEFEELYNYDDIRNSIYSNEAVIATIENDVGNHEVFITSFLEDGTFKRVDPGTGTFVEIEPSKINLCYPLLI